MRRIGSLLLVCLISVLSCGSNPEVKPEPQDPLPPEPAAIIAPPPVRPEEPPPEPPPVVVETVEEQVEEQIEEEVFDPESISQERFDTALSEVQAFVGDLNRLIRARDYNTWTTHLADSYFSLISSETFLTGKTEELYIRDQIVAANLGRDPKMVVKKLLKTPRDYFNHVIVPSRSNDRLDDIAFVSENRVKAYTMDTRGNRLVLYDLEIIDNEWKIIS